MSDVATGAEAPSVPMPAEVADTRPISVDQAAKAMSDWRAKQAPAAESKPEQPRVNGRFASADAPPESPLEGADAAAPLEPTGETQEADPAEVPPLDLPRSWSKDKAEQWSRLDRETQEILLDHDKTASAEVRRAQNEAAETRKTVDAEKKAAEQARQQYETATQNALKVLEAQTSSEFADIKSDQDLRNLAEQDPFRFVKWQAHQQQLANLRNQVDANERKRAEDQDSAFKTWSKEQDDAFTKQFPEFADKEKSQKARDVVRSYLTEEVGIPDQGLAELWSNPLFRDAKTQRIMYDAARFRAAQQNAKAAIAAPKPPVQRPGTSPQRGANLTEEIAAAEARLKSAKGNNAISAAADLMAARRKTAARR